MRLCGAVVLLLLLSGCLASHPKVSSSSTPPPSGKTATACLQISAPQAVPFPNVATAATGTAADLMSSSDDGPIDEVTAEDNEALSSKNQVPPDNEGPTVAPKEKVTFDFPVVENKKVKYFLNFYSGPGHRAFGRWLQRSGRYLPLMRKIFKQEGLPQDLAYLAMVESGFNARAYSWAHAVGPWQFISSTGHLFGLKDNWWLDERRNVVKSTKAAAAFLKDLYNRFDGNWYLAVASYNAGAGKISQAVRRYHTKDFWELSRGKFLQQETKNYVPKLLAALLIAKQPKKYGFTDLDYAPPLKFDTVDIPSATDLEVVAKMCGTSYKEIKTLNPELKRWCTPPGVKNYRIKIPAGTKAQFLKKYAQLPPSDRAHYQRHRVVRGDTLRALAHRYHIRVDDIVALNKIRDPRALQIGINLILPLKKGYTRRPMEELGDDYVHSRRQTYTVRSGDSLWSVSQRFSVSEKQLRVWNRLGWSNLIHPGRVLVVSARAARRRHSSSHRSHHRVRKIVYKVRRGDTLWGIGQHFEVATRQIMDWNNLSRNDVLQPGDTLTLLVPVGARG